MPNVAHLQWQNATGLQSRSFVCGYCGSSVASDKGYHAQDGIHGGHAFVFICHQCSRPTFIDYNGEQTPGYPFGHEVADVSDAALASLYREARNATATSSFTAAVLCCRKLLMHIAVAKGAKPGESFVSYVQFLADNNYVPPDARGWVDHIRTKGNEANHEISIMSRADAEELLSFIEMLLRIIYEFPAAIQRRIKKPTP
jgi:Domain of unknown function (DUF4145)